MASEGLVIQNTNRFIGRCCSPQGGGTGPGRVRTGRACCAVEVVRPSCGPEEDVIGRPRLAREGGPRAGHRGQRACSLESSCPSLCVSSFVSYATRPAVGPSWRTNCALSPAASGRRVHRGVLTRMARSLTLARWGTDGAVGALTNPGAVGY